MKILRVIVYWWFWCNEMYRRSYWSYVTGQDWFWMHMLTEVKDDNKESGIPVKVRQLNFSELAWQNPV